MKLANVALDDDERPREITLVMSVDEAALLYALTGHLSPAAVTEAAGGEERWGSAVYAIADCLSGAFFNRWWDGGASEVAPRLNPRVGS